MNEFLIAEIFERFLKGFSGQKKLGCFFDVVGLMIGQEVEYGLLGVFEFLFRIGVGLVVNAYVADAAVFRFRLVEVAEELSATAHVVVGGVCFYGVDVLDELLFALVVHAGRYHHVATVYAILGVGDEWCLALRDEMEYSPEIGRAHV